MRTVKLPNPLISILPPFRRASVNLENTRFTISKASGSRRPSFSDSARIKSDFFMVIFSLWLFFRYEYPQQDIKKQSCTNANKEQGKYDPPCPGGDRRVLAQPPADAPYPSVLS